MNARDFFHYCKIAYLADKRPEDTLEESLSGGRCTNDTPSDGTRDFSTLMKTRSRSSPPVSTEPIKKRPQVVTHGKSSAAKTPPYIDSLCHAPQYGKKGYKRMLRAPALTRLAEALLMVLALHAEVPAHGPKFSSPVQDRPSVLNPCLQRPLQSQGQYKLAGDPLYRYRIQGTGILNKPLFRDGMDIVRLRQCSVR